MATSISEAAAANPDLASGHQENVFPPFDAHNFVPQIIWLIIIFGLLYWLMSRIALPRVEGILEARRTKLDTDLADAARMQQDAKQAGEAYDQRLAAARANAQALAQQTHDKLHDESEARRHALEAELNAKLAAAESQIADTKTRAMSNVTGIATETAISLVEHLTGRRPSQDAVSAAVSAANLT